MAIGPVNSGEDYSLPARSRAPKKELDRNDFLNLMMIQLQNQNPLEPQSNEEFISTMLQFNSLQSLTAIDKNTQYNQAMELVGKVVTIKQTNKESVEGIVQSAGIKNNEVVVYVNGVSYSSKDIISVKGPAVTVALDLLQAASMIGKEISVRDGEEIFNGVVEKVRLENGSLKIYVSGLAYDISNIIEIKSPGVI